MKQLSYNGRYLLLFLLFVLSTINAFSQSSVWSTSGNNGTNGFFVGTLDAEPLILKTHARERFRIRANGEILVDKFTNLGSGFVKFENDGSLIPFPFNGNTSEVLAGDGNFQNIELLCGWKQSGFDLVNINTANVGIGTNTPGEKLTVIGNILNEGFLLTRGISIIGRAEGERISADTVKTSIMMMDTLSKIEGETRIIGKASVSDKFGIGTKYPTEALEIIGNSKVSGNSNIGGVLNGNIISANDILLQGIQKEQLLTTDLSGKITAMSPASLQAYIYSPTTLIKNCGITTETMAWTAVGSSIYTDMPACAKVGIGTTNPMYTLDVAGTARISGALKVGNSSIVLETLTTPQGLKNNISTTLASGALYLQSVSGNNQHTVINVNNTGYVGIGISEPDAKLHVDADDNNRYAAIIRNGAANGQGLLIRTGASGLGGTGLLVMDDNGGELFKVNNGNGNVGIGVINSQYKLDVAGTVNAGAYFLNGVPLTGGNIGNMVNGDMDVCGTVRGKKVVVELSWCDYVFEKNYALKSIDEVAYYIREYKHLPGIKAATEVESKGLDIGEMQASQMEKIEEMMLYIIELKKEIDILKKKENEK